MAHLKDFERVGADDGYIGEAPKKVKYPMCITVQNSRKWMMCIVRQYCETVKRKLNQWQILKAEFHHDISFQHIAFSTVAVVTQVTISDRESLLQ
jgi:hypothetical protein